MASVTIRELSPSSFRLRLRLPGSKEALRTLRNTTRADAERAAQRWREEVERNGGSPAASPMLTLADWMQTVIARAIHLRPNSVRAYDQTVRLHLGPLAGKRLKSITTRDALAFKDHLAASGLGNSGARRAFRMVRSALAEAVEHGVVEFNPFARVANFSEVKADLAAPTPAEAHKLMTGRPLRSDRHRLALMLPIGLGLRPGETCALRWRDIDFEAGTATISAQIDSTSRPLRRVPLKTDESRRTITIPADLLATLRAAHAAAADAAHKFGVELDELPILPARDGRGWYDPNAYSLLCARALADAGLEGRAHALRHTHATALISAGVSPSMVQRRLGHSDIKMTLGTYAHALPVDDARAAEVINGVLAGPPRAPRVRRAS